MQVVAERTAKRTTVVRLKGRQKELIAGFRTAASILLIDVLPLVRPTVGTNDDVNEGDGVRITINSNARAIVGEQRRRGRGASAFVIQLAACLLNRVNWLTRQIRIQNA